MSAASGKAALDALAFVGGDEGAERHLNMEAVELQEAFIRSAGAPRLCPFCSMSWDDAEATRLLTAHDAEGYARWYRETLGLPVNEQGDDWGQRPTDA